MKQTYISNPVILKSPRDTFRFAKTLGSIAEPNDFLILEGPLGVGKTHFVKGLAHGLSVPKTTSVSSPSFTLVNEYKGRLLLYHIDLYRLGHESELSELGFTEFSQLGGIVAVEWLSKFPAQIPQKYLKISLSFAERKNERILTLEARGDWAIDRAEKWLRDGLGFSFETSS